MAPLRRRSPGLLAPLASALLAAGCSTANDAAVFDAGTTVVDPSAPGTDAPNSTSDPGEGEVGTGTTTAEGGGDEASGAQSDTTESPLDPEPVDASTVDDLVESAGTQLRGCDDQTPVVVQLRTVDAGAAASPAQARDAALSGWLSLTGIGIRPWEFFNYFRFDYPAAEPGAVTATPQLVADKSDELGPFYELQLGVRAATVAPEQRPKIHLTLALDNSGSMEGKSQNLLRAAGAAITGGLRQGDTVSIVTWNAANTVVLEAHPVAGADDPVVLEKLDQLVVGGSAELYTGLTAAYKLAESTYEADAWNPVILVSDGGATADAADLALIAEHAASAKLPGIYLTGVGVGDAGIYRSDLMDAVARAGRGASLFIGSEAEAQKQFGGAELHRHLGRAVRDVVVRVELPPGFEVLRDPTSDAYDGGVDPGAVRLGPGGALVLHRRLRSCAGAAEDAKLVARVSWVDEATGLAKEIFRAEKLTTLLADKPGALAKGRAVRTYAEALLQWQAHPADFEGALGLAKERLLQAEKLLPQDGELAEIGDVLDALSAE
jgi:Ca-activated chloride channel family protein